MSLSYPPCVLLILRVIRDELEARLAVSQLPQGGAFDLPHAFPADSKFPADFGKCVLPGLR